MDAEATPRIPDFALLAKIGQGSYGEVWLALGVTGVFRAVKVVKRSSFAHERPFEREFQGVTEFAKVSGTEPSQLAVLHAGWGQDLSHFYYVMELADDAVSGRVIDPNNYVPLTLAEMAKREGRLSARKVLELGQALARSLATLHRHSLVHRDVKPSNVVIVGGVPKLADIGLVTRADEARTFVGTERYAAPEGPGSPRADVYGACRVLAELWTGTEPDAEGQEVFPVDSGSESLELAEVLRRGCSVNPAERQKDGQGLLEELLLLQAGKSVKRLRLAESHSKRLRAILRVGAVVGAVAAVAALGAIQFERMRTSEEVAKRKEAEAERDRIAARSLYASEIGQAQRALGTSDLGQARSHLKKAIEGPLGPVLKGVEWDLLWKRTQADAGEVIRASGPASADLHFSSEGRWLAWIEEGGALMRYSRKLRQTEKVVERATRIVALGEDGTITVETSGWDLMEFPVSGKAVVLAKLQGGEAAIQRHASKGWLVANLKQAGEFHWLSGTTADQQRIQWNIPAVFSGTEVFRGQIEMSPDGNYVAVVLLRGVLSDASWNVKVFDTASGGVVCDLPFSDVVSSLDFTADSESLLLRVSSESRLEQLRISTGKAETVTSLPGRCVGKSEALQDSRHSISIDRQGRVIEADAASHSWSVIGAGADLVGLCFATARRSGEVAVANGSGEILVWSQRKNRAKRVPPRVFMPNGGGLYCHFEPKGNKVVTAVAPDSLAFFSLSDSPAEHRETGAWRPLCVTGGTGLILLGDNQGRVRVKNFDEPENVLWEGRVFESKVWAGASAAKKDVVVLFRENGDAVSMDLVTKRELARFHACDGAVLGLCVDPDGQFAYVGDLNGDLSKWSLSSGAQIGKRLVADTKIVYGLTFVSASPDGQTLVGCPMGSDNRVLLVLDAASLQLSRVINIDTGGVWAAAFSPDGKRLLAGSSRNRLHVLEVPTYEELPPLDISPWLLEGETNETGITGFTLSQQSRRINGVTNGGVIWSGEY